MSVLRIAAIVFPCALVLSSSCAKYPTIDSEAEQWAARLKAFDAAVKVKLPQSTTTHPANEIPRASATGAKSSSVFELRWTQRVHDWSKVTTGGKAGAVEPLVALAKLQHDALAKAGFRPLRSMLTAAAGQDRDAPLVGMRLREKTRVAAHTHTNQQNYPVKLGQGLVHRRIYLAVGTGAVAIARNEWVSSRREVRSELVLVDLSAKGHGYPAAELSLKEFYKL
jgi:hypothetical protein